MANLMTRSLVAKLVVSFQLMTLVAIVAVGYLSFSSARTALEQAEFRKLDVIRDIQKRNVQQYLNGAIDDITTMMTAITVRTFSEEATLSDKTQPGSSTGGAGGSESEEVKKAMARMEDRFTSFMKAKGASEGYEDFLVIDGANGRVLYTLKRLSDSGGNVKTGALKDSGVAKVWEQVVKTQKPALTDFGVYEPIQGPAAFVGGPVLGVKGDRLYAVLALRLSPKGIDDTMKLSQGAGKTAETYLVGQDFVMRSNSRFESDSTVIKKKVDTEAVTQALQGKTGEAVLKDYRGESVLSSYADLGLKGMGNLGADFKWGIIAQIDVNEAIRPAVNLAYRITLIALLIAVLAFAVAYLLGRTMVRPIGALAGQVSKVGGGDLSVQISAQKREDEVGVLAKAFQAMLGNLQDQTRRTLEGVNVLSSSAAQISATVSQLAASTQKTSAAVAQTVTTVDEVRQAAALASDKAKNVADRSLQSVQISESGNKATEDTIHRMNLIKEQMESIGETVVRLSERSQAIEDIIATVQDLADQSNLLAVNASIEAARAGDQGKGFAVVAQEIKSLADQSKRATEQVKSILDDTRKWVSAVVMATEQGGKAVDAGVKQSILAGESIRLLTEGVSSSSQAATIIHTSSEQQAVGVNQVASAMASIAQAMDQNMESTSQLESAARKLEELGGSLKELIQRYKI